MNDRTTKVIDTLLISAIVLYSEGMLYELSFYEKDKETIQQVTETEYIEIPVIETKHEPVELEAVDEFYDLRDTYLSLDVHYQTMSTKYLGKYFITAYCPEECGGSWKTSSGATCHYSDEWNEPTTCAIDRNFHGFGEFLLVNGKLYITEDTGPGVRGAWIDCFVETMDEVRAWDTGYKSVYSVSFEDHIVKGNERKERHELIKHFDIYCSRSHRSDHRLGN